MIFRVRYTFKDLREISGFRLKEISEKTGLSVNEIKSIESDSGEMEVSICKKLSKFYNIDTDYIFIGKQTDFDKKLNNYLGGTQ